MHLGLVIQSPNHVSSLMAVSRCYIRPWTPDIWPGPGIYGKQYGSMGWWGGSIMGYQGFFEIRKKIMLLQFPLSSHYGPCIQTHFCKFVLPNITWENPHLFFGSVSLKSILLLPPTDSPVFRDPGRRAPGLSNDHGS